MTTNDLTKKLHGTTDAMVWATEWCRIAREIEASEDGELIDEGWMVGWFANAMCVAEDHAVPPLRKAMRAALNELGVPDESYPSPVANAVEILVEAGGFTPMRCSPARPCREVDSEHIAEYGECFVRSYERFIDLGRGSNATDVLAAGPAA